MSAPRVLLVAEESAGAQAVKLISQRATLVAALTSGDPTSVAGVAGAATRAEAPVWPSELVAEPSFAARVVNERVDLLLNVHSLHIAHPDVVAAPRLGGFNLHPGPLPRYAGLSVPSWAIYRGERRHGVTVHRMVGEVDAGPIAYAAEFDIDAADTGLAVSAKAVRHGLPLLERLLDDAADGAASIPAVAQDLSQRRCYPRRGPHGGRVPWRLPARRIVDLVRASDYAPFQSPWGSPVLATKTDELELVRAATSGRRANASPGTVEVDREGSAFVAAADEWVKVERLRAGGEAVRPDVALNHGEMLDSGASGVG